MVAQDFITLYLWTGLFIKGVFTLVVSFFISKRSRIGNNSAAAGLLRIHNGIFNSGLNDTRI